MKNKMSILGCILTVMSVSGISAEPVTYHIDNTHSSLQFIIPFFGVSEVAGRFDQFCGTFLYDQEKSDQNKIILYILSSSINTGIGMRDRDLRDGFFESEKYPFIEFTSSKIKPLKGKMFKVTGTLNMHGVVKEITFDLTTIGEIIAEDGKEWGLKSSPIILDRTAYGINKGQLSGDRVSVGNQVTIASFIRLRENTIERKQFEKAHPAVNQDGLQKFVGTFNDARNEATIQLLYDKNKLFVIFRDKDWIWMREAFKTADNQLRIYSRNDLIELQENQIIWKAEGNEDRIFNKLI